MQTEFPWEVRMPSIKFDLVRALAAAKRFVGRVELRRVVADGLWDLVAIVDCEIEADARLIETTRDKKT